MKVSKLEKIELLKKSRSDRNAWWVLLPCCSSKFSKFRNHPQPNGDVGHDIPSSLWLATTATTTTTLMKLTCSSVGPTPNVVIMNVTQVHESGPEAVCS